MKIDDARNNIGSGVVYTPTHGHREDGVITSVNESYVFVRYAGSWQSKATSADDLVFLARPVD